MMRKTPVIVCIALLSLAVVSCGYRFVNTSPGEGYALAEVRNMTGEPGLDKMLEESFRGMGSFDSTAEKSLYVIVTGFGEAVAAVSSEGITVRERLKMDVEWKVRSPGGSQAIFGKETLSKTYPYSEDAASLEWNRSAAIRLLVNSAAERILDRIEGP